MSTDAGSNNRLGHAATVQLTPCEFEIMEVLWETGSGTVRQVHTALKPTRNLAYTTIMTVMDKLHRKGALAQRRQGRAYVYTVRLSHADALHQRITHLIRHYFQGSSQKFLEYLRNDFGESETPVEPAAEATYRVAPQTEIDTTLL